MKAERNTSRPSSSRRRRRLFIVVLLCLSLFVSSCKNPLDQFIGFLRLTPFLLPIALIAPWSLPLLVGAYFVIYNVPGASNTVSGPYFDDPPSFDLSSNSLGVGGHDLPDSGQAYYMVFASDSQFYWSLKRSLGSGCATNASCQAEAAKFHNSDKAASLFYNNSLSHLYTRLFATFGSKGFQGVVINGDLTSFGHDDELNDLKQVYQNALGPYFAPGLGNHDHKNNVNDCGGTMNTCASQMVQYIVSYAKSLPGIDIDFENDQPGGFVGIWGGMFEPNTYSGSLSYAFVLGNYRFLQLNYHPAYVRSWESKAFESTNFRISSALDNGWLQSQFEKASAAHQSVVLLHHAPNLESNDANHAGGNQAYINFLCSHRSQVAAIFVGHYHANNGEDAYQCTSGGKIPYFFSGGAEYGTFLLAKFGSGAIDVWRMKQEWYDTHSYTVSSTSTASSTSPSSSSTPVPPEKIVHVVPASISSTLLNSCTGDLIGYGTWAHISIDALPTTSTSPLLPLQTDTFDPKLKDKAYHIIHSSGGWSVQHN